MALGERCLQRLPEYWDRGIAPADHDGVVEESENYEDDLADIDPREETLVIARTNRHVKNIAAILDDIGIPFRRTKSRGETLNRDLGMAGLWKLQHGEAASAEEWTQAIDLLPSKTLDGRTWLTRGSKSSWNKGLKEQFDYIFPEEIERLGATVHLQEAIKSGAWGGLCDGGTKWANAAKRWGVEVVEKPLVKIGTIHSVKGMEASKVIVLTSVGRRTRESEESDERRFAEERRIEYVACTRAKHRLVVAHDPRERYRMELPV
jgi:superfamily I DNA/RNA helicase